MLVLLPNVTRERRSDEHYGWKVMNGSIRKRKRIGRKPWNGCDETSVQVDGHFVSERLAISRLDPKIPAATQTMK